jgi:hypothetical protein
MNINVQITENSTIRAWLWAGLTEDFNYQIEDASCNVTVGRSDEDRVAIHAVLPDGESEDAGIYLTKADALTLSALLAAAVVDRPSA